ncbi:hypothetical protein DAPPUDRAFT_314808 [Daphnia pulex]|uniref:Uncharacterized protein n=1 Tax=Daphnia pulex TaxID=6669 RepID=E9G7J3_DAPPU|nr:hypothetical protein DAPPUDRAFT_314808 [Daphnia pulex]|eukprot:EFX84475.1 hypothetical protein DAPPUDRAFT_314808 [Daphnia pulex]
MGFIKVALIFVIFTTLAYFVLPGNAANAEMAKKSNLVSPIYIQDLNADEHKMKKFSCKMLKLQPSQEAAKRTAKMGVLKPSGRSLGRQATM